jgi:hypothetical protein
MYFWLVGCYEFSFQGAGRGGFGGEGLARNQGSGGVKEENRGAA